MMFSNLPVGEQAYLRDCARTGEYVDPLRLSAQLRKRVDAQALRQRPVVDGQEYYYITDVFTELDSA